MEMKEVMLSNGVKIPHIMISTNHMEYEQLYEVIRTAVQYGAFGFDTAPSYSSESDLGKIIKDLCNKHDFKREQFFIQDKIDNIPLIKNKGHIASLLDKSLKDAGLEYFDAILLHWPTPDYYIPAWRELESAYEQGLVRSIGICNCRERHLNKLLNSDIHYTPMIAQIELHPLRTANNIVDIHSKYSIVTQSYTPLCRMIPELVESSVISQLAEKYQKSKAQIILKWQVQNDYIPVFKTKDVNRLVQNLEVFDFSLLQEEMHEISLLNQDYKYHVESVLCPGF